MEKTKFRYNPLTLSYERIEEPFSKKLAKIAIRFGFSLLIAAVFIGTFSVFFDTPKEKILKRNNAEILLRFEMLEKRISEASSTIDLIQRRDNHIYRSIFEADTIPTTIRLGGVGGANHYNRFDDLSKSDILVRTATLLDQLSWKVYIQSKTRKRWCNAFLQFNPLQYAKWFVFPMILDIGVTLSRENLESIQE
jgi:hypothetical protein